MVREGGESDCVYIVCLSVCECITKTDEEKVKKFCFLFEQKQQKLLIKL